MLPRDEEGAHGGVEADLAVGGAAGGGYAAWRRYGAEPALPPDLVRVNGRIEAEQIDIASKRAGRLADVLVEEGQMVPAGAVVAGLRIGAPHLLALLVLGAAFLGAALFRLRCSLAGVG